MAKQTTWFRLDPVQLLIEAMDCTPKEWKKRTIAIAKALATGERGKDEWADRMMDDAESYVAQRRDAGRSGGFAKARRLADGKRDAGESVAEAKRTAGESVADGKRDAGIARASTGTVNQTVNPTVPIGTGRVAENSRAHEATPAAPVGPSPSPVGPSGKKSDSAHRPSEPPEEPPDEDKRSTTDFDERSFRIDPYGYLASIHDRDLPEFAAWFCREPHNKTARRRYGGFCKERGARTFRAMLEQFVGECLSGEEPDNRGAALTRRVVEAWT